jgi:hypothetical protein
MKLEFSRHIFEKKKKKAEMSNFIRLRPVEAESKVPVVLVGFK